MPSQYDRRPDESTDFYKFRIRHDYEKLFGELPIVRDPRTSRRLRYTISQANELAGVLKALEVSTRAEKYRSAFLSAARDAATRASLGLTSRRAEKQTTKEPKIEPRLPLFSVDASPSRLAESLVAYNSGADVAIEPLKGPDGEIYLPITTNGSHSNRESARLCAAALDKHQEYSVQMKAYTSEIVDKRKKYYWDPEYTSTYIMHEANRETKIYSKDAITPDEILVLINKTWAALNTSGLEGFILLFVPIYLPIDWSPMRTGEINCVASALLEALAGRKTRRGHRSYKDIILEWNKKFIDTGAHPNDIWSIERELECKISFTDFDGNVIASSGWNPSSKTKHLYLVRHNAHCYTSIPIFPSKNVRDPSIITSEWNPHSDEHEQSMLAKLAISLSPTEIAWVVKSDLVLNDGKILRSQKSHQLLIDAADIESGPHDEALKTIGGVQAYRFKKWIERNNIKPTHPRAINIWGSASVECAVWQRKEKYLGSNYVELDMTGAFLACEDPSLGRTTGPAQNYVSKFKMPTGSEWRLGAVTSIDECRNLPGSAVQFSSWKFAGHPYLSLFSDHLAKGKWMPTPLAVALVDLGFLVRHELRAVAFDGFASQEPLKFLNFFHTTLKSHRENKDLSRKFIGNCAKNTTRSIIVSDTKEADYIYGILLKQGSSPKKVGSSPCVISYTDMGSVPSHQHIRAYVLAYNHINLLYELKKYPNAVRIASDSITIPKSASPTTDLAPYWAIPAGLWRIKSQPRWWASGHTYWGNANPSGAFTHPHATFPPPDLLVPLTYNSGGAGVGKSSGRIHDLRGQHVVCLGKDWENVRELASKIDAEKASGGDMSKFSATTWHSFFKAGCPPDNCQEVCGKCLFCTGWTPDRMGDARRGSGLPDFLLIDEAGFINAKYLLPILKYCMSKGVCVVIMADLEGQMPQFHDRDPTRKTLVHIAIESLGASELVSSTDYRSLCPDLKYLKKNIWKTPDDTQKSQTLSALPDHAKTSLHEALKVWDPRDIFAVTTRAIGAKIQIALLQEHQKRFPREPVPMRFSPPQTSRAEFCHHQEVPLPGYLVDINHPKTVPAYVGTRVLIPFDEALWYMNNEPNPIWVYDGWKTISALQSKTIDICTDYWPKLFIMDEGLGGVWNRNATYTAISRVRHLHQLHWVHS